MSQYVTNIMKLLGVTYPNIETNIAQALNLKHFPILELTLPRY